ncbi:hypothetical protein XENTR_v10024509 [Xenopus tropicalis]|uniref:Zinc finger protein 804A n=1 Tax=Xenopus tropicalis TaxID=8364 RepID=A0A6I8QZQ8_XENTR|nr:zinc finger protein 804A [Xenopus tropicalis]KAE8580716.1 hypothetical protein XENTR_v10024509 [Xenopus tropicalis]|eukprot:XP_002932079.1 PREDICTED: zinc finger protein 804A [Xenopus tropicalis]
MECYYIVISSSHLSKGHFRNIKGVFRGPLTHSRTLDCAEKENTRSKTLEDLKANFYCDLCDKQYHKHQEFDNHINSYDHAHKQRLKELKQREFARNVASKLRKDERKQKKYLHRLHRMANLKREATCAPGSGPMFKSTTVSVQDHIPENLEDDLAQSVGKGPEGHCFKRIHDKSSVMPIILASSESSENYKQHFDYQTQKGHGHKFSFSFAFPKKAQIKLESSAAVFYKFNDDISAERGLKRRSRFVPESFTALSALPAEVLQCPSKTQQSIAVSLNHSLDNKHKAEQAHSKLQSALAAEVFLFPSSNQHSTTGGSKQALNKVYCLQEQNLKQMLTSVVNVFPDPDICHLKVPHFSNVSVAAAAMTNTTTCMQDIVKDEFALIDLKSGTIDTDPTVQEAHCKELTVPSKAQQNENTAINQSEYRTQDNTDLSHCLLLSSDSVADAKAQRNDGPFKRPRHAFYPVQSKDGSMLLQWPSEMLMHTGTEPSISYSCNPLYFDFRTSKSAAEKENIKNVQRPHPCDTPCPAWDNVTNKYANTKFNRNSIAHEPERNMKQYNVFCFVNGNKKHISSCYLDKIYHLDTKYHRHKAKRCKKHDHKCKMRQHRCKHGSQDSGRSLKCRYRHRWSMDNGGVGVYNSLSSQYKNLKGSPGSIDDLVPSNQVPDTEGAATDRSGVLQIKPQCGLLNRKAEFESPSQHNMTSLHYQLGVAPINHVCDIYSAAFSNLSTDRASSSQQKPDAHVQQSWPLKRKHGPLVDEPEMQRKKRKLYKPFSLSIQQITFSEQNYFILWKAIQRKLMGKVKGHISVSRTLCRYSQNKFPISVNRKLVNWQKMSFKSTKCVNNINQSKDNKGTQVWDGFLEISDTKEPCLLAAHIPGHIIKHEIAIKERIPGATSDAFSKELNYHGSNTCSKTAAEQRSLPPDRRTGKEVNSSRSCTQYAALEFPSQNTPTNSQSFPTGQFQSPVSSAHPKHFLPHRYAKKHNPCAGYRHELQPIIFPRKLKIAFPSTAAQSCSSLYPALYEQPFCSSASTMVQHTFTHHHVTVLSAASFATASTDTRVHMDFQQQFVSPQAFPRAPLYQVTAEPRLCPVDHVFPLPRVPVVPASVHHCLPLPFPPISHTAVFSPLHIPQPSLIPLQSIF